jgi:hypothetical protein
LEVANVRNTRLFFILVVTALLGASPSAETSRLAEVRLQADLEVVRVFRPSYPFWQHIFTIPDGRIAFGSAKDGRLVATFPSKGDWTGDAVWLQPDLGTTLADVKWPLKVDDRRDLVVARLEPAIGPLVHNPTRGRFLMPNVARYGSFVGEWGSIYERFGVPADIGLAQAILESGLDGTARSRSNALGLCQWLRRNWQVLDRLSPVTIEAYNQTTQAPYCAAYLSILSTMYGSFIPALSEHHSGGVNVGRTLINGERLGGATPQEQYFKGSQFAHDLRAVDLKGYRDLYRTYGVRSFRYAEMVFGNMATVAKIRDEMPQERIYAMRTRKTLMMGEITKRSKLTASEVQRFNPALLRSVPAKSTLYLPAYVPELGDEVAFWHRPAPTTFTDALDEFLQFEPGVKKWLDPAFESALQASRHRFEATGTEEGQVMATMLAYVIGDLRTSRRAAILEDFRNSGKILDLFQRGIAELATAVGQRD